jgi:hypothetical protein
MQQLLAALFSLFVSTSDAEALTRLPDTRLTLETAAQHLAAARIAGALTAIDPDLLLAIAYHESRFELDVVGPSVGNGKHACGVMQPVPLGRCPAPSLFRDYLGGARHLETWIRVQHGDVNRGLIGYAGGHALLKLCESDAALRACSIARVHQARAKRLKRARETGAAS